MIRELNAIAGNYHSVELCYTSGGATFKPPEAIVLTLYNNGLMLDDEPFRPFDDVATAQFIQDINDGYFPTELQAKYPGGITLVVGETLYNHKSRNVFFPVQKSLYHRLLVSTKFFRFWSQEKLFYSHPH